MSTMKPMYGIPAAIRYALVGFTNWDDAEIVGKVLEEVRDLLNEHASKLTVEQIRENMEYVTNLEDYLNGLVNIYSQMGITLSDDTIKYYSKLGVNLGNNDEGEDVEEKEEVEDDKKEIEYTSEQKFSRHVLADYKNSISSQLTIFLLTLKALEMAKDVLGKYLPDNNVSNGDNKALQKVNTDRDI